MNARFKTACALFATAALFSVTIATLATPASAASACTTVCNLHIGHPSAIATGSNELGLQFQSSESGWIAGVCFWEAGNETGTHTVSLWDSTGTRVATATGAGTPGEEGCVNLNPPAPITANTTYTASYTSNVSYDVEPGQFFSMGSIPPLSTPLHAGAMGAAGSFPTPNAQDDGYGVDVAFIDSLAAVVTDCSSSLTAPTNPSAGPGPGSAAVSWFPATSNPPGCVAGYIVTPFLNGVAQAATLIPGGIGTTTVISGLTDGSTYTFSVAAESGQSVGPSSPQTGPVTIGTPTAPTAMAVTQMSKSAVKITFKASHTNGATITKYTATCKGTAGGVTRTKAAKKSPIVVSALSAGKSYRCSVRATNRRGNGPARRSAAFKA